MLTEDDVVDAVCSYLERVGYKITRKCATTQRGDDIVAEKRSSPIALYIEAKGETSNRKTSKKYGKPFSRSQCRDHVANAFYRAARMLGGKKSTKGVRVGVALPDNPMHRELIAKVQSALHQLRIGVFWVGINRQVTLTAKWYL